MYGKTQEIKAKYENLFLYHVKLLSMSSQMNWFLFLTWVKSEVNSFEKNFGVFCLISILTLWVDNSASFL